MAKYVAKRVAIGAVTLFLLATITFFMMHIMPGSPFASEKPLPADVVEQMEKQYGLDKPIHEQYIMYLKNALKGDFGDSFKFKGYSVTEIIGRGLATTMSLGVIAFIIAVVVGFAFGIISAFSKNKYVTGAITAFASIGVSLPSFIIAILMMVFFGVILKVLPTVGLSTPLHYILPSIALALYPIAYIARMVRSNLVEVLKQDYIVMARSKGLSWNTIILRHALKNAVLPVVTYLGPLLASLVTGSFVVESIFSIPGIGMEFVKSINNRDYSVIMGMTIFFGALIIVANIVVDIISALIDPRIKLEG